MIYQFNFTSKRTNAALGEIMVHEIDDDSSALYSYSYNTAKEDFIIYEDEHDSSCEGENSIKQEHERQDSQDLETMKLRDVSNFGFRAEQNPAAEFDEEVDSLEILPSPAFDEDDWSDSGALNSAAEFDAAEFDEEIDSLEIVPSLTFDEDEWSDLEIMPSKTFDEDEAENISPE